MRKDIYEISEPLEGDDAERFIEYINNPGLSPEHDALIDNAVKTYREMVKKGSANDLFEKKRENN